MKGSEQWDPATLMWLKWKWLLHVGRQRQNKFSFLVKLNRHLVENSHQQRPCKPRWTGRLISTRWRSAATSGHPVRRWSWPPWGRACTESVTRWSDLKKRKEILTNNEFAIFKKDFGFTNDRLTSHGKDSYCGVAFDQPLRPIEANEVKSIKKPHQLEVEAVIGLCFKGENNFFKKSRETLSYERWTNGCITLKLT